MFSIVAFSFEYDERLSAGDRVEHLDVEDLDLRIVVQRARVDEGVLQALEAVVRVAPPPVAGLKL